MPSGSHSGSGGSHFGGSSSGGSHFGGGSSIGRGHSSIGPRQPMVIHWGRTRYVLSDKHSSVFALLIPFLLFAIFGILISSAFAKSNNSAIRKIETDYEYYQDMCKYALYDDNSFKTTAKITDIFDNCGKYYITYEFYNPLTNLNEDDIQALLDCDPSMNEFKNTYLIDLEDFAGSTAEEIKALIYTDGIKGYSFSIYTLDEIHNKGWHISSTIDIALNCQNIAISEDTNSIPIDYLNIPITKDAEYLSAKSQHTGSIIGIVVCSLICVGLVVAMVVVVKTDKQKTVTGNNSQNDAENDQPQTVPKQNSTWICMYCNNVNPESNHKCSQCGARRQ